jgi:hypothetical protein
MELENRLTCGQEILTRQASWGWAARQVGSSSLTGSRTATRAWEDVLVSSGLLAYLRPLHDVRGKADGAGYPVYNEAVPCSWGPHSQTL